MLANGYDLLNYLDDLSGIENDLDLAVEAYLFLESLLEFLGVDESKHKDLEPARRRQWLGIIFDTHNLTLEMPYRKIDLILDALQAWALKESATNMTSNHSLGSCCTLQSV